jgi:DNA-binding transcriptional LysR family regulator
MKFTLKQLDVFVAIARAQSVSRAAGTLSLSQSAASTALAEMERQFDCQLFDRIGKRLQLNGLGQQLLPAAVDLLDRAREFEELLHGRGGFGALNVGATLTVGNYLATLFIGHFMQLHPQSRVQLSVHNTATVVQQVLNYSLDLGMIEGEAYAPELVIEPWLEDELVVFAAPSHPLAGKQATLDRLAKEPWILRERGSGTRETFDRAVQQKGGQTPFSSEKTGSVPLFGLNVRLELEHTEAIKRAVESGLGIGCISRLALRDAFRRKSLLPIDVPDLNLRRYFYFIWHRSKYQTQTMRAFIALCQELTKGISRSDQVELPAVP